ALQFMHSVGWVHGDISTSNVLCAAQTGKLADIKYAKHMDSKKSHEVCTVSKCLTHYDALQMRSQKYLFTQCFSNSNCGIPFRYSPLHGMESVLWIAVWVLCFHVDQ
ncbi:hypothetical protein EDD15DRAFT_2138911, partial [Pisolithus albus]